MKAMSVSLALFDFSISVTPRVKFKFFKPTDYVGDIVSFRLFPRRQSLFWNPVIHHRNQRSMLSFAKLNHFISHFVFHLEVPIVALAMAMALRIASSRYDADEVHEPIHPRRPQTRL
jgi:hypothetical protein